MPFRRIGLTTFITLLTTLCAPFASNLLAPLQESQVLAQTQYARKTEAGRLLIQGVQQFLSR